MSEEKLKKEIESLKETLKLKGEECDELRERYKTICAGYCWTLNTDFD